MLVVVVLHSEMSVLAVVAVLRPPESEWLCSSCCCSESAVAYSGSARLVFRAGGGGNGGVPAGAMSALRCTSATWMVVGVTGRERPPDDRRLVLDDEELTGRSSMLREGVTMAMSGGAVGACVFGTVAWVGVCAGMVCM